VPLAYEAKNAPFSAPFSKKARYKPFEMNGNYEQTDSNDHNLGNNID
jgi:hypothetical protein